MDLSASPQAILVVGGAGFIGSHMVKLLLERGQRVLVLDNLSSGHRDAVLGGEFIFGDAGDRALLQRICSAHAVGAVMHFASHIEVAESVRAPAKYYRNNLAHTLTLLEAMRAHGVQRLIFSSTAAVYGEPRAVPIAESHACAPINPYGRGKWMVEQILQDYCAAYDLRATSLRYFNAAGADPDGGLGERHEPETHLIPRVLRAALDGTPLSLYGDDYATADGTCVRDYVHVADLCTAHWLALTHDRPGYRAFNLGNSTGFSVREVIRAAERVSGRRVRVQLQARRDGDPAVLVADARAARAELGWSPQLSGLEQIVGDAWRWLQRGPARHTHHADTAETLTHT